MSTTQESTGNKPKVTATEKRAKKEEEKQEDRFTGLTSSGLQHLKAHEASSGAVDTTSVEDKSISGMNIGPIDPFWNKKGDMGSSAVDAMMVNFTVRNAMIDNQSLTTYEIRGRDTTYNNSLCHFDGESDPEFEKYLAKAKGQSIRFLIQHLQRLQKRETLTCHGKGLQINIPQRDTLDGYIAYMQDKWHTETDDGIPMARLMMEEMLENPPAVLARESVFIALKHLLLFEKGQRSEDSKEIFYDTFYDAYIFALIVLFTFSDSTKDMNVKQAIDDYTNEFWYYKSEIRITDIRAKCRLYSSFFPEKTPDAIAESINKQIKSVEARSVNDRNIGVIQERREVSRITVQYRPRILFDDWTIDQLIASFFNSLHKKNVKLEESEKDLRDMICSNFRKTRPTVGGECTMSLTVNATLLYDPKILHFFGLGNTYPGDRPLKPRETVAATSNKRNNLSMNFVSCTTSSLNQPRLTYKLEFMTPINETVNVVTPFDVKLAYKLLHEYIVDKDRAMEIYHKLLDHLMSKTIRQVSSNKTSAQVSPVNPGRHHTPQQQIDLILFSVQQAQNRSDAAKQAADNAEQAFKSKKRELTEVQGKTEEKSLGKLRTKAAEAKELYEESINALESSRRDAIILIGRIAPKAKDAITPKIIEAFPDVKKTYDLFIQTCDIANQHAANITIQTQRNREEARELYEFTLCEQGFEMIVDEAKNQIERDIQKIKEDKLKERKAKKARKQGPSFLERMSSSSSSDDEPFESSMGFSSICDNVSTFSEELSPQVVPNPDDTIIIGNVTFQGFTKQNKRVKFEIANDDGSVTKLKTGSGYTQYPTTAGVFTTQSFDAVVYGLNILDVKDLELDDPRFRENGDTVTGFYPHQIRVIETIGLALSKNRENTLILEASVGSGKTTVVLGIAKYMQLYGNGKDRPFLIYTSTSLGLLRTMLFRCEKLSLGVIGVSHTPPSYKGKNKGIIFRTAGKTKGNEYEHDPAVLNTCDIVICHVRTLVYLLELLEQKMEGSNKPKATGRPYSIIIDEISTSGGGGGEGGINTENEHAIGAILAFQPQAEFGGIGTQPRKKNIAIFSASVKSDGPIRYFTSQSVNPCFVNNSTILVPTELRQMARGQTGENLLLDPFFGYNNPAIIKKVKEDAFFRRFISNANNNLLESISSQTVARSGMHRDLQSLQEQTSAYFEKMSRHFVMENSVIYNMYPEHEKIRHFMEKEFETIEYIELRESEEKLAKETYNKYLEAIGDLVSQTIELCQILISKCVTDKKELEDRTPKTFLGAKSSPDEINERDLIYHLTKVKFYIEFILSTFDFSDIESSIKKFHDFHNDPKNGIVRYDENYEVVGTVRLERITTIITGFMNSNESLSTIHNNILALRSLRFWAQKRGSKVPPLHLARYEDELNTIRNCPYYAMVGTRHPTDLMHSIYGSVVVKVLGRVNKFHSDHKALFDGQQKHGAVNGLKPREEVAKKLHDEFTQASSSGEIMLVEVCPGFRRKVETFEDWLYYKKQEGHEIGNIGEGKFSKEQQDALKATKEHPVNVREEFNADVAQLAANERDGPTHTNTQSRKFRGESGVGILQAWKAYRERVVDPESNRQKLDNLISELSKECDLIVKQHMLVHTQGIRLSKEIIVELMRAPADIYLALGVCDPKNSNEIPLPTELKHNRLFCNKKCAHGLDIPLEAVIFTRSVEEGAGYTGDAEAFTADDILQMSGRCGRPSKSSVSVVYMTGSTYWKCLTGSTTEDLASVLLRFKYYKQEELFSTGDGPEKKIQRVKRLMQDAYRSTKF